MGIKGDVKKTRYLYMVGQTRVHVDEVEGLGNFMELEVGPLCLALKLHAFGIIIVILPFEKKEYIS